MIPSRIGLALLLAFVCAGFAPAQTSTAVTVRLELSANKAVPNQTVKGVVRLTFPEGLHAYQNPPSKDYMIPLLVTAKSKTFKLLSVKYPKGVARQSPGEAGEVMVYEGSIEIPVTVKMPAKPGFVSVALKVSWQSCTKSDCMPPSEIVVTQKVRVATPIPKKKK